MPLNNIVDDIRAKYMTIKTAGTEKVQVTIMLAVLANDSKLPSYMIVDQKTMYKSSCVEESLSDANLSFGWPVNLWWVGWQQFGMEGQGCFWENGGSWCWNPLTGIVKPEIQAIITGSSMNTYSMVMCGVDDFTAAVVRFCGKRTVQRPPKAAA